MKIPLHLTTLLLVLVLGTILPACQKCETCSYTVRDSYGKQETYSFPETCGAKYKRQMQKETCQTMAQASGTTCLCDKK